jgi:hypothetical protein
MVRLASRVAGGEGGSGTPFVTVAFSPGLAWLLAELSASVAV